MIEHQDQITYETLAVFQLLNLSVTTQTQLNILNKMMRNANLEQRLIKAKEEMFTSDRIVVTEIKFINGNYAQSLSYDTAKGNSSLIFNKGKIIGEIL